MLASVHGRYWRQTLAGTNVSDWDFTRFVPDMVIVNLGSNDIGSSLHFCVW